MTHTSKTVERMQRQPYTLYDLCVLYAADRGECYARLNTFQKRKIRVAVAAIINKHKSKITRSIDGDSVLTFQIK